MAVSPGVLNGPRASLRVAGAAGKSPWRDRAPGERESRNSGKPQDSRAWTLGSLSAFGTIPIIFPPMIPIPAWAERFQTGDLDEVRSHFSRYGTGRRDCIGRGALSLQWRLVFLGSTTLGWQHNNLGQRVRASAGVRTSWQCLRVS